MSSQHFYRCSGHWFSTKTRSVLLVSTLAVLLRSNKTTKNPASLNVKGRKKRQAKRSKGPAERSAAFDVLLSLGFLNLAVVWWLSLWFMSTARAFYSRRCRCYGEGALLWPRSPWYKSLGSVSSRFTQPRGLRPSVCKSWRDLHLVM